MLSDNEMLPDAQSMLFLKCNLIQFFVIARFPLALINLFLRQTALRT